MCFFFSFLTGYKWDSFWFGFSSDFIRPGLTNMFNYKSIQVEGVSKKRGGMVKKANPTLTLYQDTEESQKLHTCKFVTFSFVFCLRITKLWLTHHYKFNELHCSVFFVLCI